MSERKSLTKFKDRRRAKKKMLQATSNTPVCARLQPPAKHARLELPPTVRLDPPAKTRRNIAYAKVEQPKKLPKY